MANNKHQTKSHLSSLGKKDLKDPFNDVRSIMKRFLGDMGSPPSFFGTDWKTMGRFKPKIELHETPELIEVTAELAGLEEKDIDIELSDGSLMIKGEKRTESERKDDNCHISELTYGRFSRSIPLPTDVDRDKVEANFRHGVLKVRLPKTNAARSEVRKIPLKMEKHIQQ